MIVRMTLATMTENVLTVLLRINVFVQLDFKGLIVKQVNIYSKHFQLDVFFVLII